MPKKKENTEHINELLHKGPKIKAVKTYGDLVRNLEALKVDPKRAMRLINDNLNKSKDGNTRFNWKMMKFTLYIWERLREFDRTYLKPKIDTVREVVSKRVFKDFFEAYFPDEEFDQGQEIIKLNKLIAEEAQQKYFTEGFYKYPGTNKIVEQKVLDRILSSKY